MSNPVRNIIFPVAVLCASVFLVSNAHATLEGGHTFYNSSGNAVYIDVGGTLTGCGPGLPDRLWPVQSPG